MRMIPADDPVNDILDDVRRGRSSSSVASWCAPMPTMAGAGSENSHDPSAMDTGGHSCELVYVVGMKHSCAPMPAVPAIVRR